MSRIIPDELDLSPREKRALLADLLRRKTAQPRKVPLSFAQQRLWFLDQMEPGGASYNISRAARLKGRLNLGALRAALNAIAARHESLRTNFVSVEGEPSQVISASREIKLAESDLQTLPQDEREREARRLILGAASRGFDLAHDDLLRASLFRLGDEDHALLLTMHHIVSDGWSMSVLFRELAVLYDAFSNSLPSPLPELPIQYGDFALWQRQWLQGPVLEEQVGYWKEQLAGAPSLIELPTDRPRPALQTFNGAYSTSVLTRELAESLNELSRREGVTLFMTLLAAYQTMLARYTRQEDIVVGTPIANRTRTETEGLIGFFTNTLVMRTDLSGNPTFLELLARVRQVALSAYAHQDLPFEKLVEELNPFRDVSHSPLFQVLLVMQNMPREAPKLGDLTITGMTAPSGTAKFDLTLFVTETGGELSCWLEFNTDLFDQSTAVQMLRHFAVLLEGIVAAPDRRLSELPLLTQSERHQLLVEWNLTEAAVPETLTIQEMFERQVQRTPDADAVLFAGERLSYAELNRRANQLAHWLRKRGVGPDAVVGICMERSLKMVVGVLATLKAGGAYLPLDPAYPRERLFFMLADGGVKALLTQESLRDKISSQDTPTIALDSEWKSIASEREENPRCESVAENLAYVIYTSGSTGDPKGVAMTQRALTNLISWQLATDAFAPARTLQFASLSFDVSFQEMFSTWCSGGKLFLISEELRRDAQSLLRFLGEQTIERIFVPFVFLQHLADVFQLGGAIPQKLREIFTAGEQLEITPQIVGFCQALPNVRLYNHYGPSESHVVTAHTLAGLPDLWPKLPPVGRPISNANTYVLDQNLRPLPIGVPGELCLGGAGLSRGYLNRPDLTAAKFLPNPFGSEPGSRIYLTGDLARFRNNGSIEFLGRIDDQVKIRGFRIEPGEIETTLTAHPAVREVVVVAREEVKGDRRLVAYIVAASDYAEGLAGELRSFLKERLPDYMIPAAFVMLDVLPLTASGKIDRRALPAPDPASEADHLFEAPRTPVEETLAAIWSAVLKRDRIGAGDNFFDLGGHSLLATQVMSRIRSAFQLDLPLRLLFQHPTVAGLAACVDEASRAGRDIDSSPLVPMPRASAIPVSFAQRRLWFLDQLEPGSASYHISRALRVKGRLDLPALRQSLEALLARHESLRTTFTWVDREPVQVISPARKMDVQVVDLTALEAGQRESEARRLAIAESQCPFNLARDQLLRVTLFQLDAEEYVLLLVMHHIVSDGWSMGILFRELAALYDAFAGGRPSPLPELPIQYADFALWQRQWFQGEVLQQQLDYWKKQLSGAPAVLELPQGKPRPAMQTFNGAYYSVMLPKRLCDLLDELSRGEGATLFMTLLAAFQTMLSRYSGQEDIVVGTPIANRTRRETEDLIGFFVNTLVLRTDLSRDPSFRELIKRVRDVSLQAYAHQDLPFEKLVEEFNPVRDVSRTPLFQVLFAMQNAPTFDFRLTGLELAAFDFKRSTSKFDLSLYVGQGGDRLTLVFEYNTDLFDATTIDRMGRHFVILLEAIVSNPEQRLSDLPLLSEAEREQLLVEWIGARADYPHRCIHEVFAEQARATPDAVAVVFEKQKITFGELDQRANQLAHYLSKRGIGPESVVAVCVDRSIEMVVALFGVLKAGAAFVPVDPSYPAERVAFLLQNSRAPIVLTQRRVLATLPASPAKTICVDEEWPEIARETTAAPPGRATPENAAYVIYTSGSTGQPKGSVSPHQASLNRFAWMWKAYPFAAGEICCQKTSLSFGDSIWEIFGPLLQGIPFVIIPDDVVKDPHRLVERLNASGITRFVLVPSLLRVILEQERDLGRKLPLLKYWTCSGEALPVDLAQSFKEKLPGAILLNLYGSSELAADVTFYEVNAPAQLNNIPIGRPIDNIAPYILDARFEPAPIGVCGELYISGAGLARCYLDHPELTAEKFLPCPFSSDPGVTMFKTGDLARYREDGTIEFLGRADYQVKIRGFRVELGEIEAALKSHPAVRNAVAMLRQVTADNRMLVSYIVPQAGQEVVEQNKLSGELRIFLKQKLPEYMIPGAFVLLDQLPLTPSGKIDRGSLPLPVGARPELDEPHLAPRDDLERQLARIWENLLGVQSVGVRDNFFDLGGHSLLAVRLVSDIEKEVGQRIPLVSFFQGATIEYLAELLRRDVRCLHWPTLIEIQTGGAAPPLFCVSTPNVNALGYRSLAHCLGPDQPVYGLQAQYAEDLEGEHSQAAVEELATDYMEAMRTVRPEGPYQLIGMCRGAHIAYEMARRLEAEGQKVLLGILDTWVMENTYNRFLYVTYYFHRFKSLLGLSPKDKIALLRRKLTGKNNGRPSAAASSRNASVQGKNPLHIYFPGPDFVPKTYSGDIVVFRVRWQPLNRIRDFALGWRQLTTGRVDVHVVQGQHGSVLKEQNVPGLAEALQKCLLNDSQVEVARARP
jgi:amino acid adenylation domain-containing protein